MKQRIIVTIVIALLPFSFSNAADIAAGKGKAATCVACHGQDGISSKPNVAKPGRTKGTVPKKPDHCLS